LGNAIKVAGTAGENFRIRARAAKEAALAGIWLGQRSGATLVTSRKIRRCFERVNQLLSLLVPVSDINRAAAGRVAASDAVAFAKLLGGE